MTDFSAGWPDGLFETILAAIESERPRYTMGHTKEARPPIPTEKHLRELVEIAILASLEKEEGRPADFSLVFCTPDQAGSMPFAASETLTAEEIRRLMPMTDSEVLGIAVRVEGESLLIWGLAPRREDAVVVRVASPGRLALSFGGATLARFQGNQCTTLASRVDDVLDRIGTHLPGSDTARDLVTSRFLWSLVIALRGLAHGGTVAVLGGGPVHGVQGGREFAPPLRDLAIKVEEARSEMRRLLDSYPDELPASLLEGLPALRDLQTGGLPAGDTGELLRTLAHFTQIDGALLLDQDFQVLRAGAKFVNETEVHEWSAWKAEVDADEEVLTTGTDGNFSGTRHSSALRFVAQNRGCLVFVCSQDGSLTVFVGSPSAPPKVLSGLESLLS